MELYTKAQLERLLANGAIADQERMGEVEADLSRKPVVKWFTPWGNATWLISEIDPETPDIAFGLCDLGVGIPELGSVSIAEIKSIRRIGLGVERDLHFTADKSLVDYADEARLHNRICA